MIYAAILAGGIGKRIEKYSIPKQFISIDGVPIIVMTIRKFLNNNRFNKIYVAVHPDWKEYFDELLKKHFSSGEIGNIKMVDGGKERLDSFINIMNDIIDTYGLNDEDILICHDSVRPFVQQQMINDCIDATLINNFALTTIPATDTVFLSHDKKFADGVLSRENLYNGQTPSGFNIMLLRNTLAKFGDEEKSKITGTMQLIIKSGEMISMVNGHSSNFKITTDNDIDMAEQILHSRPKTRKIELVDVTLRDGGIVNDFNFGIERIGKIKETLEQSGVEYIECGYINEKKGNPFGTTCFDSDISIEKMLLSFEKRPGVTYLAMIDYGTFDVDKLRNRSATSIDGIRLAFHKENQKDAINVGKMIIEKGYDLFIQPMVCMRYSDEEYKDLIIACNEKLTGAKGFYIVDSFGQMNNVALINKLNIADRYLDNSMKLGFHAHNNMQMAFCNALSFIEYNSLHDVMIDASILGMGKGAGNLCTELIQPILNKEGNNYYTNVIYDSISEYFEHQQKITPWGYNLSYYLSSLYSCTPSYVKLFLKDSRVNTDILIDLLKNMPEEKRTACDYIFAEKYLKDYFSGKVSNKR